MAQSIFPLVGNPTVWGNKKVETFDWVGPTLYTVGGTSFPASNFNWGAFEAGFGGVSQAGTYRAEFRFSGNGAQQTVKIVVFVVATGLQAAAIDLSAQTFRLTLIGV